MNEERGVSREFETESVADVPRPVTAFVAMALDDLRDALDILDGAQHRGVASALLGHVSGLKRLLADIERARTSHDAQSARKTAHK